MRLHKLKIKGFRRLKDVEILFGNATFRKLPIKHPFYFSCIVLIFAGKTIVYDANK